MGFVSLSEVLDLTMPSGSPLAGMLAVLAEIRTGYLRDRMKAEIDQARKDEVRKDGISKPAIAKQLGVSRISVVRLQRVRENAPKKRPPVVSSKLRDYSRS